MTSLLVFPTVIIEGLQKDNVPRVLYPVYLGKVLKTSVVMMVMVMMLTVVLTVVVQVRKQLEGKDRSELKATALDPALCLAPPPGQLHRLLPNLFR